jgi:nicotinate-nucleotide pyrophosphorylase (carboxylating)
MGLYDMIMIKDNHIDYAGGIETAIQNTANYLKRIDKNLKIEIEARNFDELVEILRIGGIQRIMLDNFSIDDIITALEIRNKEKVNIPFEASGNINEKNILSYALTGIEYISSGSLTHSVNNIDITFLLEPKVK